ILEVLQAGDFEGEPFEFIFTRNKLNNESEIIKDLNESLVKGSLSKQTVTERHPYAATDELERIEEESSNLGDDLDQYVHDLESRLIDEGEDE
ncbi:MAG TPA: phage portal protein, partial [Tissierellaceae bacterium]